MGVGVVLSMGSITAITITSPPKEPMWIIMALALMGVLLAIALLVDVIRKPSASEQ